MTKTNKSNISIIVKRFFLFIFPVFFLLFFVVSPAFASTKIGDNWHISTSVKMTHNSIGDITSLIDCSHLLDFFDLTNNVHHQFSGCTRGYTPNYTWVGTYTTGWANVQTYELWDLTATSSATPTPALSMYIDVASTSALANGIYAITGELYIIGWILAIGVGWYIGNWVYRR